VCVYIYIYTYIYMLCILYVDIRKKMNIRNNFFLVRVNRKRLPREVGESLSLEVSTNRGDVTLRDVVSGYGGDGSVVGLGDLRGLL